MVRDTKSLQGDGTIGGQIVAQVFDQAETALRSRREIDKTMGERMLRLETEINDILKTLEDQGCEAANIKEQIKALEVSLKAYFRSELDEHEKAESRNDELRAKVTEEKMKQVTQAIEELKEGSEDRAKEVREMRHETTDTLKDMSNRLDVGLTKVFDRLEGQNTRFWGLVIGVGGGFAVAVGWCVAWLFEHGTRLAHVLDTLDKIK